MNISTIDVNVKLLSPLCHFGDEVCGTMQTARRMKYMVNGEFIDIPVFSGNALRGILRTLVFQDLLEKCGMSIHSISQNLFYTLFNGGSLKSGGFESLAFKDKLADNCPALVLLGSSFGNQMTEGKLKCGILRPVCKELNDYNKNRTEKSLYSGMIQEVFQTRHDKLKTNAETVSDALIAAKETMQMKYEFETISAGTMLETTVQIEFASELEKSCAVYMLELLAEKKHIGGKSSDGFGEIELTYVTDIASDLYKNFVASNVDKIRDFLAELDKYLQ